MTMFAVAMIAHAESGGWWKEYVSLLHDPAHILLELTLMAIFDGLLGMVLWPLGRRWLRRHDRERHGG